MFLNEEWKRFKKKKVFIYAKLLKVAEIMVFNPLCCSWGFYGTFFIHLCCAQVIQRLISVSNIAQSQLEEKGERGICRCRQQRSPWCGRVLVQAEGEEPACRGCSLRSREGRQSPPGVGSGHWASLGQRYSLEAPGSWIHFTNCILSWCKSYQDFAVM